MAEDVIVGAPWKFLEKGGKNDIVKFIQNSSNSHSPKKTEVQRQELGKVLYQTLWATIKGNLTVDETTSVLSEALDQSSESLSLFTDILGNIDFETACLDDKIYRDRLLSFISTCGNLVPERILKERLDPETLEGAELIQTQKVFNQKLVRTKTKLFYKQQKFNLFREESEGYAKLIAELQDESNRTLSPAQCLENILSLIGFFHLDPNRVLDVILESFECHLDMDDFFVALLSSYLSRCDTSGLCHIVGFKFQFYHDSPDLKTPTSLFTMAAKLLKHDLLELKHLYPHLKPEDSEIIEGSQRTLLIAKEEARKLNSVILSDIAAEDEENESNKDVKEEQNSDNQKVGLCIALLKVGAWEQVNEIFHRLPSMALVGVRDITKSLCYLVHCTIEPMYRRCSPRAAKGHVFTPFPGGPEACHQATDLPKALFPMLCQLGPYLASDPVLLVKIIRVAKNFMKEYNQASEILKGKWENVWSGVLTLLDEVLLPSLSLLECNCGIAEELWGLIRTFPYHIRYRLYGQWKNDSYNLFPSLIVTKARTIKRAKYITKRLSKENVKQSGRQIGKLSHSNPGVVFDHLLTQIQRYDNFIGPVVDALKYLTPLAYDVLAFCIVESLANPARERMKLADINISDWLQSLAQFCGTVFKKYSVELTGLLQYVANQLKAGKSLDLLVLREVVQRMSGIELTEEVTKEQLEALCGGELLKAEGGYFGSIRNTKKSSQRLRDSLMEGNLALPLCLLMAQQRNGIVFVEDPNRHLKLAGKLYDQCQDTLVQFGGFLASQLSGEDYKANLPMLTDLHQLYHITPDVAFFLSRPMHQYSIQSKMDAFRRTELQDKAKTTKQKLESMEHYFLEVCEDVYHPVVESAIQLQPNKIWNNVSPQLYTTFWSLSMYDLHVPLERYEAEISKQTGIMDAVEDNKDLSSVAKKKKERERCQILIEKLKEEQAHQVEHYKFIQKWLSKKKDIWFPSKSGKGERGEIITQFLQLCIFPRCVFTANDAVYCAKFIQTIHNLQTPNFSTLICFDRVFSDISYIVASLTENEATRYGRFLCSMLEMVMRWHSDKKIYEQECGRCPGFITILRATNSDKSENYLDYENFRHVCHKWQYKLTKAVVLCLESKDYTQIRNTIMVLIKIIPYYPKVQNLGQALEKRVEKICEEEKDNRQDLFHLSVGYAGMLKSKKASLIPENQFHLKEKDKEKDIKGSHAQQSDQAQENPEKKSVKREETSKHNSDKQTDKMNQSADNKTSLEDEQAHSRSSRVTSPHSPAKSDRSKESSLENTDKSRTNRSSATINNDKGHEKIVNEERPSSVKLEEKERSRSREKDKTREKSRDNEKDKDREKSMKKPRTVSPNAGEEPKKRKLDDHKQGGHSSKEGTPSNRSDDGRKREKEREKEKEKDKEKQSDKKGERKRGSLEFQDGKEPKRRKDDPDAATAISEAKVSTRKSETSRKDKDRKNKEKLTDVDKDSKAVKKDVKASPDIRHNKEKEEESRSKKHRSTRQSGRDR